MVIGPDSVVKGLKSFKSGVESLRRWSAKLRKETKADMPIGSMPNMNLPAFNLDDYNPREIIRRAVREEMTQWMDEVAQPGDDGNGSPMDGKRDDGVAEGAPAPVGTAPSRSAVDAGVHHAP
ncbi:hypothetical protein WM019_03605 [Bifidobacterium mongoliense]|uniref:hypothetical protein n=1 Tax=Bifidobacterium mongoliense TaxID=518643 RepID=UPI0030ECBC92